MASQSFRSRSPTEPSSGGFIDARLPAVAFEVLWLTFGQEHHASGGLSKLELRTGRLSLRDFARYR